MQVGKFDNTSAWMQNLVSGPNKVRQTTQQKDAFDKRISNLMENAKAKEKAESDVQIKETEDYPFADMLSGVSNFTIVAYGEDGISCKGPGMRGGEYLWKLTYTHDTDYEKVMNYLKEHDDKSDPNVTNYDFWVKYLEL